MIYISVIVRGLSGSNVCIVRTVNQSSIDFSITFFCQLKLLVVGCTQMLFIRTEYASILLIVLSGLNSVFFLEMREVDRAFSAT